MPEPFDDVRLKDVADLSDDDKGVLRENWDSLTDEEKESFADVKEEKKSEPYSFASKEDFEKAVSERIQTTLEEREKRASEEEEEKKRKAKVAGERFFPEDYKAKDWNEAAEQLYDKFKDRLSRESREQQDNTQKALDKINEGFDKEIDDLASEHEAIPKKGTKERTDFENELFEIGVKYKGVTNMHEAYDIYDALKSGKGKGGEEPSERQRELAGHVGRSGGEGESLKPRKYADLHSRSMDELIDEDKAKLGVKE